MLENVVFCFVGFFGLVLFFVFGVAFCFCFFVSLCFVVVVSSTGKASKRKIKHKELAVQRPSRAPGRPS